MNKQCIQKLEIKKLEQWRFMNSEIRPSKSRGKNQMNIFLVAIVLGLQRIVKLVLQSIYAVLKEDNNERNSMEEFCEIRSYFVLQYFTHNGLDLTC